MLVCMLVLTGVFCVLTLKDIKRKLKESLLSDDEKLLGNIQKFVGGFELLQERANQAKKKDFMVIEDIQQ